MGLSYLEKNAFIFLRVFNFYLWPLPLQWDTDYQQIYIAKPMIKNWGPSILVLAFTFAYGISSALTAFYITFFHTIERIEVMVLMLVFTALVIPVLIFAVLARNLKLFVLFLNEIMLMADRMQTGNI